MGVLPNNSQAKAVLTFSFTYNQVLLSQEEWQSQKSTTSFS